MGERCSQFKKVKRRNFSCSFHSKSICTFSQIKKYHSQIIPAWRVRKTQPSTRRLYINNFVATQTCVSFLYKTRTWWWSQEHEWCLWKSAEWSKYSAPLVGYTTVPIIDNHCWSHVLDLGIFTALHLSSNRNNVAFVWGTCECPSRSLQRVDVFWKPSDNTDICSKQKPTAMSETRESWFVYYNCRSVKGVL